jgi:hypothetical protein
MPYTTPEGTGVFCLHERPYLNTLDDDVQRDLRDLSSEELAALLTERIYDIDLVQMIRRHRGDKPSGCSGLGNQDRLVGRGFCSVLDRFRYTSARNQDGRWPPG